MCAFMARRLQAQHRSLAEIGDSDIRMRVRVVDCGVGKGAPAKFVCIWEGSEKPSRQHQEKRFVAPGDAVLLSAAPLVGLLNGSAERSTLHPPSAVKTFGAGLGSLAAAVITVSAQNGVAPLCIGHRLFQFLTIQNMTGNDGLKIPYQCVTPCTATLSPTFLYRQAPASLTREAARAVHRRQLQTRGQHELAFGWAAVLIDRSIGIRRPCPFEPTVDEDGVPVMNYYTRSMEIYVSPECTKECTAEGEIEEEALRSRLKYISAFDMSNSDIEPVSRDYVARFVLQLMALFSLSHIPPAQITTMSDLAISPVTSAPVMAQPRLLTIPGELRNRIYRALLTHKTSLRNDDLPRLVPRRGSDNVSTRAATNDWTGCQRNAYGLTQCCRQIRKELLPMYRTHTKIRIDIRNLQDYLFDIIHHKTSNSTQIHGNISIDLTKACRIDFRDVLLLRDSAPNLHLEFTHPEPDSDMMSILLDAQRWPQFHSYVAEKTTKIMLLIDSDDYIVLCGGGEDSDDDWEPDPSWPYPFTQGCFVHVKNEFADDWMRLPAIPGCWRVGLKLRNHIYTLAVTATVKMGTPPGLAHPKRLALDIQDSQMLTLNWRLFRRTCVGLTQVSHQVRAEFLPLYRKYVLICVRLTELYAYVGVFTKPLAVARMHVEIHDPMLMVDVRDALMLCATTPEVRVWFRWAKPAMHLLLSFPERFKLFYEFVAQKTEKVVIVPKSCKTTRQDGSEVMKFGIDRLDVYVNDASAEVWMRAAVEKLDVNYLGKWKRDLQLPDGVNVVPRSLLAPASKSGLFFSPARHKTDLMPYSYSEGQYRHRLCANICGEWESKAADNSQVSQVEMQRVALGNDQVGYGAASSA
ncbi:hypothetical protein OPT61_g2108 [Boeremia exigua]|uniref:Uncharacterized protein n=1 Tax=Boeremia exigua TaxID=749465 RepID=A0ACC2IMW6_9PLEO|nr:hypothetical protein OPT61_g2108 [Boeremia exigua]